MFISIYGWYRHEVVLLRHLYLRLPSGEIPVDANASQSPLSAIHNHPAHHIAINPATAAIPNAT